MGYQTAENISRDTHHHVEWAPMNREYVIWPEGIICADARTARRKIAEIEAAMDAEMDAE